MRTRCYVYDRRGKCRSGVLTAWDHITFGSLPVRLSGFKIALSIACLTPNRSEVWMKPFSTYATEEFIRPGLDSMPARIRRIFSNSAAKSYSDEDTFTYRSNLG